MRAAHAEVDRQVDEAARVAHTLAALRTLGLERVETGESSFAAVRLDAGTWQVTAERPAMSTLVSVIAVGPSREQLEDAIGRAFATMDRLIALLTRFDPASPLSVLNATGRLDAPPPEVAEVLSHAQRHHRLSGGAFDVSVAPLVDLFHDRLLCASPAAPTAAEIDEVRARVGAGHVALSRRRVTLGRPGMRLTLDGIAKGYIVDAVAAALEDGGVRRFLVNAGGDIRARGTNADARPWTVAVENPWRRGDFPAVIQLADAAVATSGSYERAYDPAQTYHHIVDAATGRSPAHCSSVSVVAPTALMADALATSVFVMGPVDGVAFMDSLAGCACLILDQDRREHRSRGWRDIAHFDGGTASS